MIDWNDAAIEAALKSFHGGIEWPEDKPRMRAALDAAVQAQGIRQTDLHALYGYEAGRADALEEAASICPCRGNEIRALMEKKG